MKQHEAMLVAAGIKKTFKQAQQEVPVLHGVDVSFCAGKSYALVGASGSGKSTLLHILGGLDTPTDGLVTYQGNNIHIQDPAFRAHFLQCEVGFMFQYPYLMSELSVLENIALPALIKGDSRANALERAEYLLILVGLGAQRLLDPKALSGGQQQRVALARALCNKPRFLLADEPTGSLDRNTGQQIIDLLIACQKEWGMGLILSTHDMQLAGCMQHIITISDGVCYTGGA